MEAKICTNYPLFLQGNFCKFLPPPNVYVFSYEKLTLLSKGSMWETECINRETQRMYYTPISFNLYYRLQRMYYIWVWVLSIYTVASGILEKTLKLERLYFTDNTIYLLNMTFEWHAFLARWWDSCSNTKSYYLKWGSY